MHQLCWLCTILSATLCNVWTYSNFVEKTIKGNMKESPLARPSSQNYGIFNLFVFNQTLQLVND